MVFIRKLASVRKISSVRPVEGADRIEVALVDGWECVVKKGEFEPGESAVYIEIDSICPAIPEFEFLRSRNFRVKTIKLRGQISQGLILPLSILPAGEYPLGADVTEILGIKKYDPGLKQEEELLIKDMKHKRNPVSKFFARFKWYRALFMKQKKEGGFPEWISKTNEERIQNLPQLFERERDSLTEFFATEKLDGSSATYFLRRASWRRFEFGVCSRNIRLKNPDNSVYWNIAKKYNIESVLKKLIGSNASVVLQGEICGNKIQGNKYHISGCDFFVFNLIFPHKKCSPREIAQMLAPHGLKTVPIIKEDMLLPGSIGELVNASRGRSVLRKEQHREGLVLRNIKKGISFKVINPDFLLAGGE